MLCASMGSTEATELVLSLGPDLNVKDNIGRTALHFACRRGHLEIVQLILKDENVDYDAQTTSGVTPLMNAVHSGNVKLVAECLNNQLNPFLKDGLDRTALEYAASYTAAQTNDIRKLIQDAMD